MVFKISFSAVRHETVVKCLVSLKSTMNEPDLGFMQAVNIISYKYIFSSKWSLS